MEKIWAKIVCDDKILRDTLYKLEPKYDGKKFMSYLTDICGEFDIPVPVVLKSHRSNFETFNITRFKPSDFVETVNFDAFLLEFTGE